MNKEEKEKIIRKYIKVNNKLNHFAFKQSYRLRDSKLKSIIIKNYYELRMFIVGIQCDRIYKKMIKNKIYYTY